MKKRLLLLGLILSSSAAMAACDGWSTVLEDISSSSSSSSGAASSSSSGTSSSSSSGASSSSVGASTSSSSGSGGGSASSSSSGGGSGGSGGMIIDLDAGGGDGAGGGGVVSTLYSTDFEGPCPNGWTLLGDWECGTPSAVPPPAAFSGTQCIATQIAGNYHDNDAWTTTTATSPSIDLTMAPAPKLTFRMWLDTEGAAYDGANLQISADNGASYSVLSTVVPAYPLTIGGEPAWGGHQAALGWQLVQADLAAYAGQTILLRFAFRSDTSGVYPGIYIDDVLVTDN